MKKDLDVIIPPMIRNQIDQMMNPKNSLQSRRNYRNTLNDVKEVLEACINAFDASTNAPFDATKRKEEVNKKYGKISAL